MQIKDCMVIGAAAIGADEGIVDAAELMAREGVGMLVVEEDGKLAGVLTDRDIAVRCVGSGHSTPDCRVGDHMTVEIVTTTRDDDVFNAVRLMRENHIKRLPVVDGGTVVGVVSITDITQAMDLPMHDLLFGGGRKRVAAVAMLAGRVSHYYTKLKVCALNLEAPVHIGDTIHVVGHTTDFVQKVSSMEIEHKKAESAYPGDDVALSVDERARVGDQVYIETT